MDVKRLRTGGIVALAAVLLTSCGLFGGGDKPTPPASSKQPTTASSTGASTPRGDIYTKPAAERVLYLGSRATTAEVDLKIFGVFRNGDYVALVWGATLTGGTASNTRLDQLAHRGRALGDPSGSASNGTTLIDPREKKAYLPAWDAPTGGQCLCPLFLPVTKNAVSYGAVAYKAPPSSASTIDVWLGRGLGYFSGIPISEGRPPEPSTTAEPKFTVWKLGSRKPPMRAAVIDLDTPVSNVDLSVTKQKDKVTLAADVLFRFDKATLTAKGKARVREAAGILRKEAHGKVAVNGFTDSKGSDSYNLGLSKRRAITVQKALQAELKGSGITLVPRGYGEAKPVAPNSRDGKDNPRGRALNRRVEIVYHK